MKKKLIFICLAAGLLMSFTGCEELDKGINISVKSDSSETAKPVKTEEKKNESAETSDKEENKENKEIKEEKKEGINISVKSDSSETAKPVKTEEKKNESAETSDKEENKENKEIKEEKKEEVKQNNDSQSKKSDVVINQSPYKYSEDIKDEGVSAMTNSDGSIRITFMSGKFALTLPSKLENHFVLIKGHISSKEFYNKHDGFYGKMAGIHFKESFNAWGRYNIRLLGRSGNTYMVVGKSTCVDNKPEDPDNPAVKEEFDLIESCLGKIYASAESYNEKTGKMERMFDVPHEGDGQIYKGFVDSQEKISGLKDDFVDGKISKDKAGQWPLENGWHIYAVRAISCEDGTYFDCYDSDDNDHYGWINAYDIEWNWERLNK